MILDWTFDFVHIQGNSTEEVEENTFKWTVNMTARAGRLPGGRREAAASERGFWQGDPFANAGFAVAIVEPTRDLKAEVGGADPNLSVYQDADDLQLVTSCTALPEISPALRRHWAPHWPHLQ